VHELFLQAAVERDRVGANPVDLELNDQALEFRVSGVLVAAGCCGLSVAQRRLSTPARELRRRTASLSGERVAVDGSREDVTAQTIAAPGGYLYCFSVYARASASATVRLSIAGDAVDQVVTSAWGRIFFLYGPYEHPDRLVASVIRSLLAGEPAKTSHGNQIRDYLLAGDVADSRDNIVLPAAQEMLNTTGALPTGSVFAAAFCFSVLIVVSLPAGAGCGGEFVGPLHRGVNGRDCPKSV
jgi:hypothetical protein